MTCAISINTFREAVRQPVFWAIAIGTAVLMILSCIFAGFALGEESRLVRDAGLTSITIAGLLLAIFLSSSVISDEIEKKTALTVLCKPVRRSQFVLGKYLGILLAVLVSSLILTAVLFVTVWIYESQVNYSVLFRAYWSSEILHPARLQKLGGGMADHSYAGKPLVLAALFACLRADLSSFAFTVFPNLVKGVLLSFCEVGILASAAVAASTRVSMILNVCLTFSLFVIGHQGVFFLNIISGHAKTGSFIFTVASRVLPNLEFLNHASDIAFDKVIPMSLMGQLALYSVGWVAVFLLIASILFERRELA